LRNYILFIYIMGNLFSITKSDLANENNNLKEEIKALKQKVISLEEVIGKPNANSTTVSMQALEERLQVSVAKLVDNMLENDNVNSSIIPDYVERKIYTNVFTILIGIMKETIDDTSINLLNQNIKFVMTPR